MKRVNMHEAKTHLSRYVAELAPGETLLLCNRNVPVAELRAISKKPVHDRRLGVAIGKVVIPDSSSILCRTTSSRLSTASEAAARHLHFSLDCLRSVTSEQDLFGSLFRQQ